MDLPQSISFIYRQNTFNLSGEKVVHVSLKTQYNVYGDETKSHLTLPTQELPKHVKKVSIVLITVHVVAGILQRSSSCHSLPETAGASLLKLTKHLIDGWVMQVSCLH